MANVYPLRNAKQQMQCLGCGEVSDAPCECNVGWKAIVDDAREKQRQRTARSREKAKQNQSTCNVTDSIADPIEEEERGNMEDQQAVYDVLCRYVTELSDEKRKHYFLFLKRKYPDEL